MAEYTVILATVAIGCMFAMMAIGGALLGTLWTLEAWLALPFP